MTSPSVAHSVLFSVGSSGGTLVLQLLTGVLTARLLGPSGRGEIEAVMSWVNLAAIVCAFGFFAGLGYLQARAASPSPSLLGSGLVGVAVLGVVGVLVTELLIPLGFSEQRTEVVDLARWMMLGIFVVMGTNLVRSQLSSNDFFLAASVNVVGQPLLYAVGAVVLWAAGAYSVAGVTLVQVASFAAMFVVGAVLLTATSGIAAPVRREVSDAAAYGLRSYGASLSRLANTRLDVVIMPAFLVAGEIGLYVVAVSVGSMMVALFQQLNRVVFTNTARTAGAQRTELVERLLRGVFYAATAIAVVLAVAGPALIAFVYGEEFRGSAVALRLLLPGLVMWTCGSIASGALGGLGLPGRTSIAQGVGLVVTVVGLAIALPRYGIEGAAVTSTLSYATVAGLNLYFLRRADGTSVRRVISPRRALADGAGAVSRLRARS